jgi:hypothetical protein
MKYLSAPGSPCIAFAAVVAVNGRVLGEPGLFALSGCALLLACWCALVAPRYHQP